MRVASRRGLGPPAWSTIFFVWWLWIVVVAVALVALAIALFRSRRGWGPRTGQYRDDQAAANAAVWTIKLPRRPDDGIRSDRGFLTRAASSLGR
jgi:nitrogen fixation-related uncharacterized protein